jgi:methionyl-tRNA synthetase
MADTSAASAVQGRRRPDFPKRAVITAGMPYGNKDLHFGHVGGVFVHADAFARFLRDRIGPENVIFVSGTDCYGSPIVEEHRQMTARGEFAGSLEDFVEFNHHRQRETLQAYHIGLNLFAASSLGRFREIHGQLGALLLEALHAHGHLEKRTTSQFYDAEIGTFLNGRQVLGHCPVQGCRSEKAYADECSLGHQYEPKDLIAPKSVLTGRRPEMRDTTNWYLRLPPFRDVLAAWLEGLKEAGQWRGFVVSSLLEHFEPPTIHVTRDQLDALAAVTHRLPAHQQQEGQAKSVKLVFARLEEAETAKTILAEHAIRYRTGKTLVPFRLTGNLEWGLPVPELEGLIGLTFWVWPESLWAPISFTAAYLERTGGRTEDWRHWWCSKDAKVYQFIGEDNIYFYGLPEAAMFLGMQAEHPAIDAPDGHIQLPHLVANRHLLFLDKKASSSGAVKPPMARDLLHWYTPDQLRAHFLSLGLGMRSVSFRPKPLDPKAAEKAGDPVLKEGNLLSNALNHAVRSCFYTAQKFYDGKVPVGPISADVLRQSETAILDFEQAMHRHEFHLALAVASDYIRDINQRWSRRQPYGDDCEPPVRQQALIDAFHMVRVAVVLMHPIAPEGTERVRKYLRLGEDLWSWDRIFQPLYAFMQDPAEHRLEFLAPRVDFFQKHPSQLPEK